jgi:transposase
VEALLQAAMVVFVIPSGQRRNRLSRYGSASNRDARFDRVAVAHQLRAHLQIVFSAATTVCAAIGFDINLRFLEHFTTADQTTCLASVAPSTRQSGKTEAVTFRWGADKQLRDALTNFADDSRHANPRAAHLYQQPITRGHDHPHAVRVLARAWAHLLNQDERPAA